MPELPEVETIRIGLSQKVINQQVLSINILNSKSFIGDPSKILSHTITNIWRRGKVLGLDLENGQSLIFHLKMSGQIIFEKKQKNKRSRFSGGHPTKDMQQELPNKSTRVIFTLSQDSRIYFNDQRKFGWVKQLKTSTLKKMNYGLKIKLGPEPLSRDFSLKIFKQNLLKHKNQSIKVTILDQSVVAGVGNIYASEACFIAKIDPLKKVNQLTDKKIDKLHQAIILALNTGIKYGGSSITHFFDDEGKKGYFLEYAYVFNRQHKPCKNCHNLITKIKVGGRGTYLCYNCQK